MSTSFPPVPSATPPATGEPPRTGDSPAGAAVILSANPIHDTGGGQRSAQMALELLERGWAVLFVSHGRVTETVDLGLSFRHPNLVGLSLGACVQASGRETLASFLVHPRSVVVTQVPVAGWLPALARAQRAGAVCVYDLIDRWDSELGWGWYRRRDEARVAVRSHVLTATAPALARDLARRTGRTVHLLPNAFNARLFRPGLGWPHPPDLPAGGPVALYVGALWGGWMDWTLVEHLARALPEVTFAFVGDHRGEGRGLPPNCHFLGLKAQSDLPAYLAHARVGLLPWKDVAVTQATSPLKVYEYLAMGLPVVAPGIEPLRGIPGVTRCGGHGDFTGAVADHLRTDLTTDVRAAMADFAGRNAWTERIDALLELVADARRLPDRPGFTARLRAFVGM